MLRNSTFALLATAAILVSAVEAFVVQPGRSIQGAQALQPQQVLATILKMSEGPTETDDVASKISADGTFYDDEVDSAPIKQGISDSMRARLMAEASTGLDSEQKQTNVVLYICVAVAILVALGGGGILY